MKVRFSMLVIATLIFSAFAFAAAPTAAVDTGYQVKYAANLNIADSVFNIVNTGILGSGGPGALGIPNALCANVYTFAPDEQMIACCSCLVTPDGLASLSAQQDLVNNTLTGQTVNAIVVKLITTVPTAPGLCNPATITGPSVSQGLVAWGTTVHSVVTPPSTTAASEITETPFTMATLSAGELNADALECTFIGVLGSGAGVCKGCEFQGLGAAKQ